MKYSVEGMSCSACVSAVEKAVKGLDGVENVSVNLLTKSMIIDGNENPECVIKSVEKAGYRAAVMYAEKHNVFHENFKGRRAINLLLSFFFLGILFFLEFNSNYFSGYDSSRRFIYRGTLQGVVAVVIIVLNRQYYQGGVKALIKGRPNMNTLVFIGSFTAFIYSLIIIIGHIAGFISSNDRLYFVTAGMILAFISIGKTLEENSKEKTTETVKDLYKLAPEKAILVDICGEEKDKYIEVDVKELKVGDVILVREGNYFPVDGIVVKGNGYVDESGLTGESIPVKLQEGDEVYTSTLLMKGTVYVKAKKVGSNTVLGSIIDMVLEAGSKKAPIAKLADRVAEVFVPVVIGIAIVTFIAWFLYGNDVGYAIARAIAVLVVSCPCAMGLATPVAIMAGSGVGAKYGILFKDAETLERAGNITVVALDKTGTLTEGEIVLDGEIKSGLNCDKLKNDSAVAVSLLKEMGLSVVMISGDRKDTAEDIARKAGIDKVISEVRPDAKGEEIIKLKKTEMVMMVGDGINDAIALTEADIGVAIGTGKDVAIDAAGVVLMHKSLLGVVDAIRLSRLTIRKVKQNLFWAFIYNIIGIPLAAGVLIPRFQIELPPMYSAAMMSVSSIIVVFNALTINRFKATTVETEPEADLCNTDKNTMEVVVVKYTMNIEGMMCAHCEARVKKCLEETEGVNEAVVSHENNSALVTASEEVTKEMLIAAVTSQGYEVISVE